MNHSGRYRFFPRPNPYTDFFSYSKVYNKCKNIGNKYGMKRKMRLNIDFLSNFDV